MRARNAATLRFAATLWGIGRTAILEKRMGERRKDDMIRELRIMSSNF